MICDYCGGVDWPADPLGRPRRDRVTWVPSWKPPRHHRDKPYLSQVAMCDVCAREMKVILDEPDQAQRPRQWGYGRKPGKDR
jgi:hypothetical protein